MSSTVIFGNTYPGISFARRLDPVNQELLFQNSFFFLPFWDNTPFASFENSGMFKAKNWAANPFFPLRQGTNRLGHIIGVTKDSNSNVLSGCTIHAFITTTDVLYLSTGVGSDGSYDIVVPDYTTAYYLVAFSNIDSTLAGTTVNTISGV